MKVYKVTLLIIDHDGVGEDIKSVIENAHYPNDCLTPKVMDLKGVDIGAWDDDNPLNDRTAAQAEFERLFAPSYEDALAAHIAEVDEILDDEDEEAAGHDHLHDADPNCVHDVQPARGGGVKCTKCLGWFCY